MVEPDAVPDPVAERHWICACRLRERRKQLALTQSALVDRLARRGVPLTNRTLSAMENGRGLDLGRLPDLAAVLSCSVTYLIGLTGDPHRWEPDSAPVPVAGAAPVREGAPVPTVVPVAGAAPVPDTAPVPAVTPVPPAVAGVPDASGCPAATPPPLRVTGTGDPGRPGDGRVRRIWILGPDPFLESGTS